MPAQSRARHHWGSLAMIAMSMTDLAASFEDAEAVYLAGSSGESLELTAALTNPAVTVADAHFITSFIPGINGGCLARAGRRSRMSVFFMQRNFAAALAEGRIEFRPMSYYGIHRHLGCVETRLETAVVQVAPPDASGMCSLGPAVEFMPMVLARVGRRIGIINPNVPRLPGSVSVPYDAFHAIVHSHAPLATYEVGAASATAAQVVAHLAPLIPNGATLQVGLGKIPAQLLEALTGHRELALHTGIVTDAALRLAAAGALRRENPLLTPVAVGGQEFYRRLHELAGLQIAEIGLTHSPRALGALSRFYAVNSALEVDLLGQVNAETLAGRYVSGPGGLPDFAHAAQRDPEGLSIIALPATDGGKTSRIVARLTPGAPVTVPQHAVDVVVTEYGAAMLRGRPLDERVRSLCAIAHPEHRAALAAAGHEVLR